MSLIALVGGMWIFEPWAKNAPSLGSISMTTSTDRAGFVFFAPKTGNVAKIGFRTGTVTTAATLDVRLETVDATTGDPSGTLFSTSSNGSQASPASNTAYTVALTAAAAVTRGQTLAVSINNSSTGNMGISRTGAFPIMEVPYCDTYTASAWTKSQNNPVMWLEYDDGSYAPITGVYPISSIASTSFSNASNPEARGLKFRFPVDVSIGGFWAAVDGDGDWNAVLYQSDGNTVIETVSFDKDIRSQSGNTPVVRYFSVDRDLTANTNYYLMIEPQSATAITLVEIDAPSAAAMDGFAVRHQLQNGPYNYQ